MRVSQYYTKKLSKIRWGRLDLEYLLPKISSIIPAILLVDMPLEYIDTIRSSFY